MFRFELRIPIEEDITDLVVFDSLAWNILYIFQWLIK